MKIPDFLFPLVNKLVRFLLWSPLHFLFSGSLMTVIFRGRKSGKEYATPVRYCRDGDLVRFFTSTEGTWWKNIQHNPDIQLRVAGRLATYRVTILEMESEEVRNKLIDFLALYPQDAVYHNVRVNPDKSLDQADLEAAMPNTVAMEATVVDQ